MKRIIFIIMVLIVSLLSANEIEFYKSSLDCLKVKQNSIEYKICTDKELSNMDKDLSKVYDNFIPLTKEIASKHKAWVEYRNTCKDIDCISKSYSKRFAELNSLLPKKYTFFENIVYSIRSLLEYGFSSKGYKEFKRTSQDPDIRFSNYSSDGKKVLLNYKPIRDNDSRSYIGILDVVDKNIVLLYTPKDYYMWYDGSFSPNKDEILFSFITNTERKQRYGLGILDLKTKTHRVIARSEAPMRSASFSADTSRIIYVGVNVDEYYQQNIKSGKFSFDILELNMETKKIKSLTDIAFITANSPRYYLDESYIFSAEAPYIGKKNGRYPRKAHMKKYKYNDSYIFNLNKTTKKAIPAIIRGSNTSYVDLSKDNKQILCISLNKEPKYNYELFMYKNKKMKQLTNIKSMIIDAALSPDAKQVVFVSDFSRGNERKIWLLDVDKNKLSQIKLNSENTIWQYIK